MGDNQDLHVPKANPLVFRWICSGVGLMVVAEFARMDIQRISVFHCLMHLGHYQFAVALSFDRIRAAEGQPNVDFETSMRRSADIHLFAVAAHGFWRALTHLAERLNEPSISACIQAKKTIMVSSKKVRDHLEHLVERFELGRPPQYGEMPQEVFSRAIGTFDGKFVSFGDERFDLPEIAEEVLATGALVVEQVQTLVQGKVDAIMAAFKESFPEGSVDPLEAKEDRIEEEGG